MNKITIKNWADAPQKLYCVQFNMGGLLHDKIYTLYKHKTLKGHYFDRGGNISTDVFCGNKAIILDEVNKKGVWQYVTEDLNKAEVFLKGAYTTLHFMNNTWMKYYKFS